MSTPPISTLAKVLTEHFRLHVVGYLIVNGGLISINILTGRPSWSFWPLLCWGVVLACHYFYVSSVNVDQDWVERRADDLRRKSYDASHILDIQDSYDNKKRRRRRKAKRLK